MNRRKFVSTSLGAAATIATTPLRETLSAESVPDSFDIAVIGAGMFGSAAARHLSAVSDSVALIGPAEPAQPETHDGVFASHYDASRLTRVVDPDLVWGTLASRSVARYREIEPRSGINFFQEIGYMMVTPGGLGAGWFDFPAMREVARDLDVPIDELDDLALKQRFPQLNFTPGSGAMLQPRQAGYIDPRRLVEAQQIISVAQGTTLIREQVVDLTRGKNRVTINTRSGQKLHANRVLLATGAYTNAVNLLGVELDFNIRAAMIMLSEVGADLRLDYPSTLYAKTDGKEDFWGLLMPPVKYPNGRTYIKTMDGYYGPAPLAGFAALGNWVRSNGHELHHPALRRALREVFPSLEVLSSHFQPCLITDTASHYPYIDLLDERVGLVVGGNGKAAKSSDEIGRVAANLVLTGNWASSLPQPLFAARFA